MEPEEKKLAVQIVRSHEHAFDIACVKELISKAHIPMIEMQNVRVAIELAMKDPSHLERGRPEAIRVEQPEEVSMSEVSLAGVSRVSRVSSVRQVS